MDTRAPVYQYLLHGCETKELWSTQIINPDTGTAVWAHNLAGPLSHVHLIGTDYMVFVVKNKPQLQVVGVQKNRRPTRRSTLPGPISALAVSQNGKILSASIAENIYTWMIDTGDLMSIVTGHYQTVTQLKFTENADFLISAGKDGQLLVWKTIDLLTPYDPGVTSPQAVQRWHDHSLPITTLHVAPATDYPRLLTGGQDQTVNYYDMNNNQCLWRIILDQPVTSAALDATETRLFVGTPSGTIVQVNLFMPPAARERHVSTIGTADGDSPFFKEHKAAVTRLTIGLDGGHLASGDVDGVIKIWHIHSKQCLKSIPTKGPVTTLAFIQPLVSFLDADYQSKLPLPDMLDRVLLPQLRESIRLKVPNQTGAEKGATRTRLNELLEEVNIELDAIDRGAAAAAAEAKKDDDDDDDNDVDLIEIDGGLEIISSKNQYQSSSTKRNSDNNSRKRPILPLTNPSSSINASLLQQFLAVDASNNNSADTSSSSTVTKLAVDLKTAKQANKQLYQFMVDEVLRLNDGTILVEDEDDDENNQIDENDVDEGGETNNDDFDVVEDIIN